MPTTDPLRATWPATVLVADDEPAARRLLRRILEPAGYTVLEAATGKEAVAMAEEERPDLLILDITMPDIDGIETTRHLLGRFPEARIIMVTSHGQEPMVMKALAAGAKGYVLKPVREDRLRDVINKLNRPPK